MTLCNMISISDVPLVHIGVIDSEKESSLQNLFTYTNTEEVELLVNGKSFGIQKNNGDDPTRRNMVYWQNIPYQKGRFTAIARNNGKEVTRHQLETTGPATALKWRWKQLIGEPYLKSREPPNSLRLILVTLYR